MAKKKGYNEKSRANLAWNGKGFPPRGADPEFDKKRDATLKKNRDSGIAKAVNRTKLWQDTMNTVLAENPELGTELVKNLINIMETTESEKTKLETIKMLAEMTGVKAPAASVQEPDKDEEVKDVETSVDRLKELGISVTGVPGTKGDDDK